MVGAICFAAESREELAYLAGDIGLDGFAYHHTHRKPDEEDGEESDQAICILGNKGHL
jgi:hypothetical protein